MIRDVIIPESITVQDLANRMAERSTDVIKSLMKMGIMATINERLDPDTAELIVTEFGHRLKRVSEADIELGLEGLDDDPASTAAASAGGHHHGPCRPRQDLAARRDAPDRCRGA